VLFAFSYHQYEFFPSFLVSLDFFVESDPVFPDELEKQFTAVFGYVFDKQSSTMKLFCLLTLPLNILLAIIRVRL